MKAKQERKIILAELEKNAIVSHACKKAGVSRSTYYRWIEKNEEFRKVAKKAINNGVLAINDLGQSQLILMMKDGIFSAIKYWLSHRDPAFSEKLQFIEYRDRLSVDSKKDDKDKLTPEERDLIKKAIELDYGKDYLEKKESDKTIRIHKTLAYNIA